MTGLKRRPSPGDPHAAPVSDPPANAARDLDAELMSRLAQGDPAPLETLYTRYARMIFSVLHHYAPWLSHAEMDDIGQDVFLDLYRGAARYTHQGKLRAFLCGMAIRKAKSLRRTTHLHRRLLARVFPRTPSSQASSHAALEARSEAERSLNSLTPALREVVTLHAVEELTPEEIAHALGIDVGTVWTRLHRARQFLQKSLLASPVKP